MHATPLLRALAAALLVSLGFAFASSPAARAASGYPAQGTQGMVVASQSDAARAGLAMLEAGGNAIDAAVATAFAISVTQPFSSGLGGGCFILIRLASGEVIAIDARETAPAAASRDMYVQPGVAEHASVRGGLAVATPGLVRGLLEAQQQYGKLERKQVLAPAIALAKDGFAIGPYHARMASFMSLRMPAEQFPETARIQFPADGGPARSGWRLVQSDLASTLGAIELYGAAGFYEGFTAKAIANAMRERGGLVTEADLAGYETKRRPVVHGTYRGLDVHSFPPPSSGGVVLLEMLNILEGFDLAERGHQSSASLHVIAEAMKLAFADRAVFLGDPDFVDVPVARLTSKAHGDRQRARINPAFWQRMPWNWLAGEAAISVRAPGLPQDDSGTTHLSVADAAGNAVAITKTINTPYGSGITVPGTGVILNNEMDDFARAPDTPNAYGLVDVRGANAIAPGKRPLSSMTPTILEKDGKLFMVTGSPGGPRIITTTLLTILGVVDYGLDVKAAVAAPRFHHQWVPDTLYVEPEFSDDVVDGLVERGHTVERGKRHWSSAQSIVVDPETGALFGGSDPRSDGAALGY